MIPYYTLLSRLLSRDGFKSCFPHRPEMLINQASPGFYISLNPQNPSIIPHQHVHGSKFIRIKAIMVYDGFFVLSLLFYNTAVAQSTRENEVIHNLAGVCEDLPIYFDGFVWTDVYYMCYYKSSDLLR